MKKNFIKKRLILKEIFPVFSISLILILFLSSCGSDKEVKKVSEDSILVNEAFKFVDILRIAYLERDLRKIEENSTRDAYIDLIGVIKSFDKADLLFTPTWVELTDSSINITISWKGTWYVREKVIDDKGVAIFVLEGRPFKLAKILRANPFSLPE